MMNAEQLKKLPKWAQEYIDTITMQRDAANRLLDKIKDNTTESPFFIEHYRPEAGSPGDRFYINGTKSVMLHHDNIAVRLFFDRQGICLHFNSTEPSLNSGVGIVPQASNAIRLAHIKYRD